MTRGGSWGEYLHGLESATLVSVAVYHVAFDDAVETLKTLRWRGKRLILVENFHHDDQTYLRGTTLRGEVIILIWR